MKRQILRKLDDRFGVLVLVRDLSGWADDRPEGPRPLAYATLRHGGQGWARFEIGIGRRGLIVTWGDK
jgi:hypothetical protein